MDAYENNVLELAEKITKKECGDIKSIFGLLDMVYNLVEETTRRIKKEKFSSEFKAELSNYVLNGVTEILYKKELISEELFNLVKGTSVSEFLDHFIDIAEIFIQNINKHCLCIKINSNNKIKALRKLKL